MAAGALPAGAVVAPKGQQQQPQQQQQAFPDLEMPKRSQQQEAALDEFEKRQRQAQQAQAAAAQPAPAAAAAQPAAVLQPPTLTGAAAGEDGAAEAAAAAAGASAGAAGGADMVLPPGTCKATNPAYAASQEQWARWCARAPPNLRPNPNPALKRSCTATATPRHCPSSTLQQIHPVFLLTPPPPLPPHQVREELRG